MQSFETITYKAFRVGRYRFLVQCCWLQFSQYIHVKVSGEGIVESLEARFDVSTAEAGVPVPFASLPPQARAMIRGMAGAILWELKAADTTPCA